MKFATEILSNDAPDLHRAAEILRAGGLVAFPTETVYGLGADARDGVAVARIFEAKGRPRFNPLIIHVSNVAAVRKLVDWTPRADQLAKAFWPGPLTLVLPQRPEAGLSDLVTAGLPTVAVRVPAHPVAQSLLAAFGGPVAAPSANPSGKISPTEAAHVKAGLSGKIEAIVDGGACTVGLESTIVGLGDAPVLLRPGGVGQEEIEAVLGEPLLRHADGDALTAPGQMRSHYAPTAPLRLNVTEPHAGERLLGFGKVHCALNLSETGDLREAAANLFHHLHALDAEGDGPIAVSPIPYTGLGLAINDRLKRAAAPR